MFKEIKFLEFDEKHQFTYSRSSVDPCMISTKKITLSTYNETADTKDKQNFESTQRKIDYIHENNDTDDIDFVIRKKWMKKAIK